MKLLMLMTTASFLALSALRAQDLAVVDPAIDYGAAAADADSLETPTAPDGPSQLAAPTTPDEAAALDQTLYGEDQAIADANAEPSAQGRPWKFNLHASIGSRYDDNIFISETDKKADFVTRATTGAGFTLGDYTDKQGNFLTADYTGIGEIFARNTSQDAYEQTGELQGQTVFAHLTLTGDLQFQDLADEDIDTGTRTRRQVYVGDFSARYDISAKTFLEATAQVTVAKYALYLDSDDERGGLSFNYLPDPSVTVGLGAMAGVLHVEDSGNQTYEQLLASLKVAFTDKFTLASSAGVEDRQLEDGGSFVTPVFQLTGDYKPFAGLDLTLTGYRQVLNSAFYTGSDYITTGVSAGVRYDLSSRFSLLLDGGYQNSAYRAVTTGASIARTDNYYFVRPAVRYTASSHCNVELYIFHRDNASTVGSSSFINNQVGVTVNFAF